MCLLSWNHIKCIQLSVCYLIRLFLAEKQQLWGRVVGGDHGVRSYAVLMVYQRHISFLTFWSPTFAQSMAISRSASPVWLMEWPTFWALALPPGSQTLTGILLPGTELLRTAIWEQPHLGMALRESHLHPPPSVAPPQPHKKSTHCQPW